MIHSVTEMSRAVRRRLERVVKKSGEKDYARRALALLHLWDRVGMSRSQRIECERLVLRCIGGSRHTRPTEKKG